MAPHAAVTRDDAGGAAHAGVLVLVVDDDSGFRASVGVLLAEAGYRFREAGGGRVALEIAEVEPVDVVVLDVNMPDLHGYETCRRLRKRFGYAVGIIFASGSRMEPYDRVAGLDAGADDYIVKPPDPGELLARLRAITRRLRAEAQWRNEATSGLTPRQLEVLVMLARGTDVIDISSRLVITPATVRKHIERIYVVLGVRNRAEAVAWAYKRGIVEPEPLG